MADDRLLLAYGKQVVFEDPKQFGDVWKDLTSKNIIEFDAELVDGDDRYMGHIAVQREHIVALFEEWHRTRAGR